MRLRVVFFAFVLISISFGLTAKEELPPILKCREEIAGLMQAARSDLYQRKATSFDKNLADSLEISFGRFDFNRFQFLRDEVYSALLFIRDEKLLHSLLSALADEEILLMNEILDRKQSKDRDQAIQLLGNHNQFFYRFFSSIEAEAFYITVHELSRERELSFFDDMLAAYESFQSIFPIDETESPTISSLKDDLLSQSQERSLRARFFLRKMANILSAQEIQKIYQMEDWETTYRLRGQELTRLVWEFSERNRIYEENAELEAGRLREFMSDSDYDFGEFELLLEDFSPPELFTTRQGMGLSLINSIYFLRDAHLREILQKLMGKNWRHWGYLFPRRYLD